MTSTPINNTQFIAEIFRDAGNDEAVGVCAFTQPPEQAGRREWMLYESADAEVADLINANPPVSNNYFCISTVAANGQKLSRRVSDVKRVFVLPLDDIGDGAGAKFAADANLPEPTYRLETSEGNFQYGYVLVDPIDNPAMAQALMKAMVKDTSDGGGTMAAKIIRLPYGINNKEAYGGHAFTQRLEWGGKRYTVAEICEAFDIDYEWLREQTKPQTLRAVAGAPRKDEVFDWLINTDRVLSDVNDKGFVKIECPWHEMHTDGNVEAVYSPLGCGGPSFEETRAFNCKHDHCQHRRWYDVARLMFNDRFVYVSEQQKVADTFSYNTLHTVESFSNLMKPMCYRKEAGKKLTFLSDEWMRSRNRQVVDRVGFLPGGETIYTDEDNKRLCLNTYEPRRWASSEQTSDVDLIQPIIDHFKYLFGGQHEIALAYFAWSIHRPQERIQWALLHYSMAHGTGRGWLKQMMVVMMGDYAKTANLSDFMTGAFNEWLFQSLFVTFDEVHQRGTRYSVQDKLRELVTEKRVMINQKYGMKGDVEVFANLMFLSNHIDSLEVTGEDRRIWAIGHEDPPQPERVYTELYQLLNNDEAMRQWYWFLHRKLLVPPAEFKPRGRAPKSPFLDDMRTASGGDLDAAVQAAVRGLKAVGVRGVWHSTLVEVCELLDAPLPNVGAAAQEWRPFNGAVNGAGLVKMPRLRNPRKQGVGKGHFAERVYRIGGLLGRCSAADAKNHAIEFDARWPTIEALLDDPVFAAATGMD